MASTILRRPWERLLAYIVLGITGFVMVFPFIYMFLSSLKPSAEVVQVPPTLWPSEVRWSNYLEVLSIVPLGTQLINTIITLIAS